MLELDWSWDSISLTCGECGVYGIPPGQGVDVPTYGRFVEVIPSFLSSWVASQILSSGTFENKDLAACGIDLTSTGTFPKQNTIKMARGSK